MKLFCLCVGGVGSVLAALVPVSPKDGVEIELVPSVQKQVMNLPTYAERLDLLQKDRKTDKKIRHDPRWRKANSFKLTWQATAGEVGPWTIEVGKKPDLSDARKWFITSKKVEKVTNHVEGQDDSGLVMCRVPLANLEIATTYYWRVYTRGRCGEWNCGPRHGCEACKTLVKSEVSTFRTEDYAPRWMAIEGRVGNMRDLGGRKGLNGARVKQGMVYRGQGLNDNSITGEHRGPNRLTMNDVEYMTGTLGIKTDLDLRSHGEVADLKVSPLGKDVQLIWHSSQCYAGIFTPNGMKVMAQNFRVFCDPKNYPIYFHCIGGADRAGSLAYTLNGVLGVERHLLNTDWESTFYPTLSEMKSDYKDHSYWCGEWHFDDGFGKYGDEKSTWTERIELYLIACGITREEIEQFRKIMLESN